MDWNKFPITTSIFFSVPAYDFGFKYIYENDQPCVNFEPLREAWMVSAVFNSTLAELISNYCNAAGFKKKK